MKPEVKRRAQEARELLENEIFSQVMAEIRDDAVKLFLNANSGIDVLERAHEKVRAIEIVQKALQSRLDEEKREEAADAKRGSAP